MSIVSLSEVAVEFGATTLLSDVTFSVGRGERWGVVGRNGTGKTTLFRLVSGSLDPTRGMVVRQRSLRIAVLDQFRDFGSATTIWEAAGQGYAHLVELERSLAEQAKRLEALGDRVSPEDLARYSRDQDLFAHQDGYAYHARVAAVLDGIGFDPDEACERSVDELSGGERGRVGLAAQLSAPADLILLDEPTNHLDLETIEWLKRYLRDLDETVLVISHDRSFLDDTADHILHVAEGTTTSYRGGYTAFATQRAERRLTLERQVTQQRKFIAKEEEYIRRNIAGQNTAQAKGRRKRLERLPRLSPPPSDEDVMGLRLEAAERGGDQVVVIDNLQVSVGDRTLLRGFGAVARRGDVIALVGPNGAGKTTLLATLLGERAPAAGTIRLGAGVTPQWFRQDLAQLPADRRIYDCVAELRPTWNRGQIQGHLGRFGFSGDEVLRPTTRLSGGEQSRVALALLVLHGANLVVLDEPTNHLDVESIEALEDALEAFTGTVLLVSHDRALLRETATRVWVFEGDSILDYEGTFVEWEARVVQRAAQAEAEKQESTAGVKEAQRAAGRQAAEEQRRREATRRKARRAVETAELRVHELEARVTELQAALSDERLYDGTAAGAREAGRLNAERTAAREALDDAMTSWTRAVEALEALDRN